MHPATILLNRPIIINTVTLLICISSCKPKALESATQTTRDTFLHQYFQTIDTLSKYGTNSLDHAFIRAYQQSDTLKLDSALHLIKARYNDPPWSHSMDSCVIKDSLVTQHVEEAYRFEYGSFMCPYKTRLEIRKYPDSISIVSTIYQYAWFEQPCVLEEKTRKPISNEHWDAFQEKMEFADFWGLKSHNDISGLDGSNLEIYGFRKARPPGFPDKKHYVSRWSPEMSSIMTPVHFLVNLCKIRQGCLLAE